MTTLSLKYNLLDSSSKKEVLDFLDFLLSKENKNKKIQKVDYKKKLLKVSAWKDSDINLMIKNQKEFNKWKVQGW